MVSGSMSNSWTAFLSPSNGYTDAASMQEIKADVTLRHIPIVVLTTSKAEEDILRTYDLGVSSFITKPVSFEGLVDLVKSLMRYWFEIVTLPPQKVEV
jgi:two-component system, response regulator